MPHTPGPWIIVGVDRKNIMRGDSLKLCVDAEVAALLCAELNAAEQVRDAAPALLAACKDALRFHLDTDHVKKTLEEVIAAAEGSG